MAVAHTEPGGRGPDDVAAVDLSDTVLVSNRGPYSHRIEAGRPVAGPPAGGLAGSLRPLLVDSGATWVACAMDDADRLAAAGGGSAPDGFRLDLVDVDPSTYGAAYNVVSNATLWFCHHHLFDGVRQPLGDRAWLSAWDAYRDLNGQVAGRVAELAPEGGRVLVQDYHLALVGAHLARHRPDLRTVHFTHTPFAEPSVLRMLPDAVSAELLGSMDATRACGFHTERWAAAYRAGLAGLGPGGGREGRTFVSPLSSDPRSLRESAGGPEVAAALARIEERVGDPDRQVIVRVDRMELSKNLLRGFRAYEELLEVEPHRRGRVVFVALAYPTRQEVPEYAAYRAEVERTVDRINERWGTPGWSPVVLEVEDDYPRSLAALTRYDVLLVNPVRDGLNLVASEGPLLNTRDGALVLSREAGAYDRLGTESLGINPFDVHGTALALARALDLDPAERAGRAGRLRAVVERRRPEDWLLDQLAAAG